MEDREFYSVYDIHRALGGALSERQIRRYIVEGKVLQGAMLPGGRKYLIPREKAAEFIRKLKAAAALQKKHEKETKQALLDLWSDITES